MEFRKRRDFLTDKEEDDKCYPKVGTLRVRSKDGSGRFTTSDGNFYPNHEVWGESEDGEFPIYAQYNVERDYDTNKPISAHPYALWASIPGVSKDGERYTATFHIYAYELKDFVGKWEGYAYFESTIELEPPFALGENGWLIGYGLSDIILDEEWLPEPGDEEA